MLNPDKQAEIMAQFFSERRSIRAISMSLGVSRDTVRRIIRRRQVLLTRAHPQRESLLDPFKDEIKKVLDRDPRCPGRAILNRLREQGYMGGITILYEYLRLSRPIRVPNREAFLRLDFEPGETAQVDWAEFGDVFGDGIKIHCFAMVLCYSRLLYIEFTRSEKFEEFIRAHENAFNFFPGVPKELWYDNLSSAVTERVGKLIRFNGRFMAYMGHHGLRPHACNVARGNEKGRVEDAIKYIRNNFWAGREFSDFEDLCKQARDWLENIANQREHRATNKIVKLQFLSEEKQKLRAGNPVPFDTDEVFSKVVPPDFHIQYETNRYSVPWTLVGLAITVRVNSTLIRIFYNQKYICSHPRSYQKNRVFTQDSHQAGLLERKPGAKNESWQLAAVQHIGPALSDYVDLIKTGHRSLKKELSKILALATVYGNEAVNQACQDLLAAAIVGVDALELSLKKTQPPPENMPPLNFEQDKLNRIVHVPDLRKYDAYIIDSMKPIK